MIEKFIAYLQEQLRNHSIYVWGAQGQKSPVVNEAWIRKMETSTANADRAVRYWKKQVDAGYKDVLRAFDCSGLGVYFLLENGLISHDMSANTLMNQCKIIGFSQLQPGDFVFLADKFGHAYHMGYVADKNLNVIEAKGRDHGVMRSPFKGWEIYGRPPYFTDEAGNYKSRILKLQSPYMRGDDVKELQTALKTKRVFPGTLDGVFGAVTEKAVRAFQANANLAVDGKAGPETFRALGLKFIP